MLTLLCFVFMLIKGELTYGKIGEWRFDKRLYLRGPPPKNLTLPPPRVPESVVCTLVSECLKILYLYFVHVLSLLSKKSSFSDFVMSFVSDLHAYDRFPSSLCCFNLWGYSNLSF